MPRQSERKSDLRAMENTGDIGTKKGEGMRFIVGGRIVEINSLADDLDKSFISLHSAYFGHEAFDWADFERSAIAFFDNYPSAALADSYFNNFTVIWNTFLAEANFDEAERVWALALEPVFKWEATHPGARIHKGTAYYFWGMTALHRGELDKGYSLMHQAVEEDVQTSGIPVPDSPAMALANLNYTKANQAFRPWVLRQAAFLNELQNAYSATYSRPFILDDFREKFLEVPPTTEALFLFAYVVARLMRLNALPPHGLKSRFAGQLELTVLFNLTLVIDAAIKAKNPGKWQFVDHAEYLLGRTHSSMSKGELSEINNSFILDLNAAIRAILDRTYALQGGRVLGGLESDISLAYGLRNHSAHDLSSAPTVWEDFRSLQQSLANVLFATVDYLY